MNKNDTTTNKGHETESFKSALESVLKEGAQRLLQQAIENEVEEYIQTTKQFKNLDNRQMVIRNGYQPERAIQTGLGSITVQRPRVRDKRQGHRFTSHILPRYARRTPSIETVIPTLYLKGISTNDFHEALEAILGKNAQGLSPANIVRLKKVWEEEHKEWDRRDLSEKHYVYMWVDGIHFNVRLDKDRPCILVIMGALRDGTKELVAVHDGYRESKLSWMEVIRDLKTRGLKYNPSLAIGDGALGFWAAQKEEFPNTRQQRCWVHKTANILDKMPKSAQTHAKTKIHDIYMAERKDDALKAFDEFIKLYGARYPKACECLRKDKEVLLTFYDFPAMHWQHIRTTNPIESTFATIRHRTDKGLWIKGSNTINGI